MIFSEATPSDATAIATLHTQSWQRYYRGLLSDDYLSNHLAEQHQKSWSAKLKAPSANQLTLKVMEHQSLVGFICVQAAEHIELGSYVENLHIKSTYRGHGLGKVLMLKAANWLQTIAPNKGLYLEVLADNTQAVQFYHGLGGETVKTTCWDAPDGQKIPELIIHWQAGAVQRMAMQNQSAT